MKDPNQLTLAECCDELGCFPTLDSIAGALPEGWFWDNIRCIENGFEVTVIQEETPTNSTSFVERIVADTEPLSRARASVMARRARVAAHLERGKYTGTCPDCGFERSMVKHERCGDTWQNGEKSKGIT